MPEDNESSVVVRSGPPVRLGPSVLLGAAVLTMATVFLPWARLVVTDPSVQVREGWYNGWELVLPAVLLALMLVPVVFSVIMLAGGGTRKRRLETGFCSFALGMELMFLSTMLVLALILDYLADSVDLFEIGMGAGFWAAAFLFAFNVLGLVLCALGSRPERAEAPGEPG